MRLKSRTAHPPGDFQILHPESGMTSPFKGSFQACCDFEKRFRQANPFIAKKNGWTLNETQIEDFVESQNVARCVAHGWTNFLVGDVDVASKQAAKAYVTVEKKTQNPAAAVATDKGHIHKAAAGIGLVADWLGSGLEPVSQELAEKRAWVCGVRSNGEGCPKNSASIACRKAREAKGETGNPLDWFQRVEAQVADAARTILGVMLDLKLETSLDSKLGSCLACDCNLKTKMWPPLNHILENTSHEVMSDVDLGCWILEKSNELKNLQTDPSILDGNQNQLPPQQTPVENLAENSSP